MHIPKNAHTFQRVRILNHSLATFSATNFLHSPFKTPIFKKKKIIKREIVFFLYFWVCFHFLHFSLSIFFYLFSLYFGLFFFCFLYIISFATTLTFGPCFKNVAMLSLKKWATTNNTFFQFGG